MSPMKNPKFSVAASVTKNPKTTFSRFMQLPGGRISGREPTLAGRDGPGPAAGDPSPAAPATSPDGSRGTLLSIDEACHRPGQEPEHSRREEVAGWYLAVRCRSARARSSP